MNHDSKHFKSLKIALKELEPFIRNGKHLEARRPFKRKAVAARLVEEAAHRQVVVFTHDLTFLYELRREADAKGRGLRSREGLANWLICAVFNAIAGKDGLLSPPSPRKTAETACWSTPPRRKLGQPNM